MQTEDDYLIDLFEEQNWTQALIELSSPSESTKSGCLGDSLALHVALKCGAPDSLLTALFSITYPDEEIARAVSKPNGRKRISVMLADALRSRQWHRIPYLLSLCREAAREKEAYTFQLPLRKAIRFDAPADTLKIIIDAYPHAVKVTDNYGALPMHSLLSRRPKISQFEVLLESFPAALWTEDKWQRLPIHYAVEHGIDTSILLRIIDIHPDSLSVADENGELPIHYAARFIDGNNTIEENIEQSPGNFSHGSTSVHKYKKGVNKANDVVDSIAFNAIHESCIDPAETISIMLESNPDVASTRNLNGDLPLHIALRCKSVTEEMLRVLLRDNLHTLELRDMQRVTPINIAQRYGTRPELNSARLQLLRSALGKDKEIIAKQILNYSNAARAAGIDESATIPFIALENRTGTQLLATFLKPEMKKLGEIGSRYGRKVKPNPPKCPPPVSPERHVEMKQKSKEKMKLNKQAKEFSWDEIDVIYIQKVLNISRTYFDAQIQDALEPNLTKNLLEIYQKDYIRRTKIWSSESVAEAVHDLSHNDLHLISLRRRVEQIQDEINGKSKQPMNSVKQIFTDVVTLYKHASLLRSQVGTFVQDLAQIGGGRAMSDVPLKPIMRTVAATAVRQTGEQWHADIVVDIARAGIKCHDATEMLLTLELLVATDERFKSTSTKGVRSDVKKKRLPLITIMNVRHSLGCNPESTSPTLGNCWGSITMLAYFTNDDNRHIFEIRIFHLGVHTALRNAMIELTDEDSDLSGLEECLEADARLRSAVELLLATGKGKDLLALEQAITSGHEGKDKQKEDMQRDKDKAKRNRRLQEALRAAAIATGGEIGFVGSMDNSEFDENNENNSMSSLSCKKSLFSREVILEIVSGTVKTEIDLAISDVDSRLKTAERRSVEKHASLLRENKSLRQENDWMKRQLADLEEQVRALSRKFTKAQKPMTEQLEQMRTKALRKGMFAAQKARWKTNRERKERQDIMKEQATREANAPKVEINMPDTNYQMRVLDHNERKGNVSHNVMRESNFAVHEKKQQKVTFDRSLFDKINHKKQSAAKSSVSKLTNSERNQIVLQKKATDKNIRTSFVVPPSPLQHSKAIDHLQRKFVAPWRIAANAFSSEKRQNDTQMQYTARSSSAKDQINHREKKPMPPQRHSSRRSSSRRRRKTPRQKQETVSTPDGRIIPVKIK